MYKIAATLTLLEALAPSILAQPYGYTFRPLLNQTDKVSYLEM